MPTIRELKVELERNRARWSPNARLLDSQDIPRFRTGGLPERLQRAEQVQAVDFPKLFAHVTNPLLLDRRVARRLMPQALQNMHLPIGSTPHAGPGEGGSPPPSGTSPPGGVDWRNRWGWPWITTVRNQGGCESCWCFAAVALVEAMVRIEHCVWPTISEGDVHKGMGRHCCDCGDSGAALDWIKANAAADPGCFPWAQTSASCSGCGGTGGGPYDNIAYTPTPDRSGRSVRIPAYTSIGSVADQKTWLDTVGPIVTWFEVWNDFFGYGSGVYHKQATVGGQPNAVAGGHFMLVVGYDDAQHCWIVKNSWDTSWGQGGFGRIGYGETGIDTYAKLGLQNVNPDPWTKRRLHNGTMVESGNGPSHRNFEMLTTAPNHQMRHWWRDNSVGGFPWHAGILQGNDVAASPTLTGTTFNRNFESVHLTTGRRLHHWWFEQKTGQWHDGGVFGPNDATGMPGFIQGNYGAPGNFEVVVSTADAKLNHWWRDGAGWHDGGRFGGSVARSGASLLQSHYGAKGNLELVCQLNSGQMQHFWRDDDHGMVWHAGAVFGSGIGGPPCMIEGQYGAGDENAVGNFELCVAAGGQVQHWWRANANNGDMLWRKSATFGHDIRTVLALVEGSFGFNLEVVVLRNDNKLQHYWRDGSGWHEGVVIGDA